MSDDEYENQKSLTFAARLAIILFRNGTLSEREMFDLMYPSVEKIEESYDFNPLDED